MSTEVSEARKLLKFVIGDFWDSCEGKFAELELIIWRPVFTTETLETVFTSIEENHLGMDIGDGLAGITAETRVEYCGSIDAEIAVQHPKIVEKYEWSNACVKPVVVDKALIGIYAIYGCAPFSLGSKAEDRLHAYITSQLLLVDIAINAEVRDASLEKSLLSLEVGKAAEDRFHDIKETLFSASGALGALKRGRADQKTFDRNVNIVLTQIGKAKEFSEKYIKEAKNPNRLYRTTFDLKNVTRSIVRDMEIRSKQRASQRSRKIDIHLDYPEESVFINGDIERIARAIGNVIYNAEHWVIRSPGKIVRVDILIQSDDLFGYIKVRDTGPGIIEPKRALEKGYSLRGGTGLGLCIAKKVFELHDGGLKIKSEANHWTSVEMMIPLATS